MKKLFLLVMMTLGLAFFSACSKQTNPATPGDGAVRTSENAAGDAVNAVDDGAEKTTDAADDAM